MRTSGRQLAIIAAVIVIAAALFIILPAFATSGDYGVNTGSLNDSQTQQSQNPTATPNIPPTSTPPPPPPDTPVPQAPATCAPNTECASPNKGSG